MRRGILTAFAVLGLLGSVLVASPVDAHDTDHFSDIAPGSIFETEILWLAHEGFINGWSDGTYRPTAPITHQALAAVLYRMSGSPEGHFHDPGYHDVPQTHPFYREIAWAASEGLPIGHRDVEPPHHDPPHHGHATSEEMKMFHPAEPVERGNLMLVLNTLSGMAPKNYPNPGYHDVSTSHPDYDVIEWASAINLANGFRNGAFYPGAEVTRLSLAAFLWRFFEIHGGHWPVMGHHEMECNDPVTEEHEAAAEELIAAVEESLARFADLDDAIAAGFRYVAPPFGGAGAHYVNNDWIDDGRILDPMYPESMMYDGETLQGAMFLMDRPGQMGPLPAGCLALWHGHDNLCYTGPPNTYGQVVWLSEMGCPDGTMVRITPMMLHVWIIDHPGGPFAGLET